MVVDDLSNRFCIQDGQCHDIQAYTPSRFVVQISFSHEVVGSPGYIRRRYDSFQDASNAWEFSMAFDTKAHFGYPVHNKENSYTRVFIE